MAQHIDSVIMDVELRFLIKLKDKAPSIITIGDLTRQAYEEAIREGHQVEKAEVAAFVRKTLLKRFEIGFFKRWRMNEATRLTSLL